MAASTIVVATRVWVNDTTNPLTVVTCGSSGGIGGGGQRSTVFVRSGETRNYGNGRVRLVNGPTTNLQATLALRLLTPAQITQLRAWVDAGTVLCFRDTYGQKIIGVIQGGQQYFTPLLATPPSVTGDQFIDLGITINLVTATTGL